MSVFRVWHKFLRRLRPLLDANTRRARHRRTFQLETLEERAVPATLYVATTGSDQATFGTDPSHPFASLQFAVNQASNGDVIKVAAGTYGYNAAQDKASAAFGTTGVVAVFDKAITLLGGYTASNFNTADPNANPTLIDGGGQQRGVLVVYNVNPTGLDLEGFTIQNAVANPASGQTTAFGGGMFVNDGANQASTVPVIVKNVVFQNDTAQGGSTSSVGGEGAGGGFAVLGGANTSLTNVSFTNDKASGGGGVTRGGGALGGGFFATTSATVTGSNLTFTNDAATSGNGTGSGADSSGQTADGLGGAISVQNGSNVSFTTVTATGTSATGGNAGSASGDSGGGGFGGVGFVENAALSLTGATLTNDSAHGGDGFTGGLAGGGGIETANANLVLNQVTVSQDSALGGNTTGGGSAGSSGGGGLYLTRGTAGSFGNTTTVTNAVITDNVANLGSGSTANTGGGGGGIYIQGLPVTITESTIANNQLGSGLTNGYSILVIPSPSGTPVSLNLNDSIVANAAANASIPPVTVSSGATLTVNRTLFVVPNSSTAAFNGVNSPTPGTINFTNGASTDVLTAPSAGFVSPGAPNFNYGLNGNSPAVGKAINSGVPVDRAGNPRPANADLGAFQFVAPTLQFANLDNQGFKIDASIPVTVTLSSASDATVTVNYATSDGTAKAGIDYRAVSGTLTFPPGQTTQTFNIPVINDGHQTGNLRINLTLSNPVNVGFGFQTQAVATIKDTFPTDDQQFVTNLYEQLLGRAPDPVGEGYWVNPLLTTKTTILPTLLYNFVNTPGYFAQEVGNHTNGFYHHYLGEDLQPGDPNVNYWANQMAGGLTDEQVIAQFVSSAQYFNQKSGASNLTWLQNAYQDILGRPLDATGQSYWLGQLAGGATLNGVASSLLASTEYRTHLISNYYELYLNRPTGATDQQYWLGQFQAGQTDEQVIVGIGGSLEGLLNNGGTNQAWITTLYQKLLGRSPTAAELSLQLNYLENDRATLFDNPYHQQRFFTAQGILSSSEFTTKGSFSLAANLNTVIAQVFQKALGKQATAGDLAYWSAQFVGDANQKLDVASDILSSSDYFSS